MNVPDELIDLIRMESKSPALPKAACRRIVDLVVGHIASESCRESSYRVPGLGTFRLRLAAARTLTSPLVGGTKEIPAKWTLRFRPSKEILLALNARTEVEDA